MQYNGIPGYSETVSSGPHDGVINAYGPLVQRREGGRGRKAGVQAGG